MQHLHPTQNPYSRRNWPLSLREKEPPSRNRPPLPGEKEPPSQNRPLPGENRPALARQNWPSPGEHRPPPGEHRPPPHQEEHQRGFSLVELMVVITVIALLSAVALPIFTNYLTRARVTEFQSAAAGARTAMAEWAMLNAGKSEWPADNSFGTSAFTFTGDYVDSITYELATDKKVAAIKVSGRVDGEDIVMFLEGTLASGKVTWKCTAASASRSWLPSNCQNDVSAGLN